MGTVNLRQAELDRVLERERNAFQRRTEAFVNVKQTYAQHGHSPVFQRSMAQADAADDLWRKEQARVAILLQQIVAEYEGGALVHADAIAAAPAHESPGRVGNGSALFAFLLDLIR